MRGYSKKITRHQTFEAGGFPLAGFRITFRVHSTGYRRQQTVTGGGFLLAGIKNIHIIYYFLNPFTI